MAERRTPCIGDYFNDADAKWQRLIETFSASCDKYPSNNRKTMWLITDNLEVECGRFRTAEDLNKYWRAMDDPTITPTTVLYLVDKDGVVYINDFPKHTKAFLVFREF